MDKRFIKYMLTFILGLLMSFVVFSYRNILESSSTSDIVMILSDGFLLPAVLIGGLGVLLFVSNGGMFDIFIFSFGTLRETLKYKKDRDPNFPKNYFEFKQQRSKKYTTSYFLVVGGVFLVLSLAFNIIFYYV